MEAKVHPLKSTTAEPPSLSGSPGDHGSVLGAAVLAVLVVAWAASNLSSGGSVFGFELAA